MFLFNLCGLAHSWACFAQRHVSDAPDHAEFLYGIHFAQLESIFPIGSMPPVLFEAATMGNQPPEQTMQREERNDLTLLEAQLRIHLRGYVCDFRMMVQNGALILSGRARTFYGKQLAQHSVMKWSQLPIRANNIAVL